MRGKVGIILMNILNNAQSFSPRIGQKVADLSQASFSDNLSGHMTGFMLRANFR